MIGFNVKQFKAAFFSAAAVLSKVDPATRKVLSKFGAFVRRTSRQSIKKRRKSSTADQAPSSQTGKLKKFIFFGYDAKERSVIIGPAKLNGTVSDTALSSLESGGMTDIFNPKTKQTRRAFVAARPFMLPAFNKELPKVPSLWKDSIK